MNGRWGRWLAIAATWWLYAWALDGLLNWGWLRPLAYLREAAERNATRFAAAVAAADEQWGCEP